MEPKPQPETTLKMWDEIKAVGSTYPVYPKLVRILGLESAVFLCRIAWWQDEPPYPPGNPWVCKSQEEIEAETALSYKLQLRIRKRLKKLGVLQEKSERIKHLQFYSVDLKALEQLVETAFPQTPSGSFGSRPAGVSSKGNTERYQYQSPPTPPRGGHVGSSTPRGRKPPPRATPEELPEVLRTDSFRTEWAEWQAFRVAKRKKLSEFARQRQLKKLAAWGEPAAIASLEQSMTNDWTGIFFPHENQSTKANRTVSRPSADRITGTGHDDPKYRRLVAAKLARDNREANVGGPVAQTGNPNAGNPKAQ